MKEISLNSKIKSRESITVDVPPSEFQRLLANREKVAEIIRSCNISLPSYGMKNVS